MTDSARNDSETDTVGRFAADLRQLRIEAGSPTYDRLHDETDISRSVIIEAFRGQVLPSARTVDAIVRACHGGVRRWLDRRDVLAERGRTESLNPSRRVLALNRAVPLIVGAFVAGIAAGAVATALLTSVPRPVPTDEVTLASTGDDPAATTCVNDAEVATSRTGPDNSLLEILWSDACQAAWARVTRYDGLDSGNTVSVAIFPQTAAHGPDRQEATEHDVQGAYTTLVLRPSPDTLLCAEGSFTVDGEPFSVGDPLCI